jgi:predicted phosphodiesterase
MRLTLRAAARTPRGVARAGENCDVVADQTADVWGLISDVHGNLAALEEGLRVLGQAGARRLAFLGDFLGRGDSDGCVRRIREVAEVAIVGNRDLDWQDRVAPASKAWVLRLPRTACAGPILLSHGDPRLTPSLSTSQIGRDFSRVWQQLDQHQRRIWAFGHSHQARVWRKAEPAQAAELLLSERVVLEPEYRYFVNVGTTGLPFPGKGGPSVALVDLEHGIVRHIPLQRA